MLYALIGCLIIIGFLGFKLFQKQQLDREAVEKLDTECELLQIKLEAGQRVYEDIVKNTQEETLAYSNIKQKSDFEKQRLTEYQDLINNKFADIDTQIEEQRQKRMSELTSELTTKEQLFEELVERKQQYASDMCNVFETTVVEAKEKAEQELANIQSGIDNAQLKFEGIQRVLRQYDAEAQAKRYYSIQLPEEFQEDIEFLLTTVSAKIAHPDIISKLVWQEYVKPNLEDTFKRIEIKAEPGIYKLTSLLDGRCYVGKSTDVKRRLTDHFKSVVGIASIADQAVHHAIRKEGFWNWQIEIITYCDKERLSELEKYYIDFFKAQDYGYNRNSGG